jgi:hypothetical protein
MSIPPSKIICPQKEVSFIFINTAVYVADYTHSSVFQHRCPLQCNTYKPVMFAGFSDNFISGARFDSDIYDSEEMRDARIELPHIEIVDYDYPKYGNTYEKYKDVYRKYNETMPYIFYNDGLTTSNVLTDMESLQYWNYTIKHFDELYDYFDNYQTRFIDICPVELKCEVVATITDEYFVLDRFSDLFQCGNIPLMQKIIFYTLIKFI